jgi:hypothetical protein
MKRWYAIAATFLAMTTAFLSPVAGAAANDTPTKRGEDVIWLAGTPGMTFAELVLTNVEANPAMAGQAEKVLAGLKAQADSGHDVQLMGDTGGAAADAAQIQRALAGLGRATLGGRARDGGSLQHGATLKNTGPTDFDLRGFGINDYRSWQVKTEIDGGRCGSSCQTTDKVKATWTITPGRTGDRFTYTSIYSPNTGIFSNIYADAWVYRKSGGSESVLKSQKIGEAGSRDGTGSGSEVLLHASQENRSTVDKLRVSATLDPIATRYFDGVRTGTARCMGGSNYECIF